VKTGESLTLAAINNQDTNNLIAKLGEQYTGFDKWTNDFDSIAQFGTAGLNTLFGYRYFGIQDSSNSSRSASLIGFNKRIENGETYCLSTFVNTGAIEPSEEWVFRIWFQKFDQSDPPISQLTGQIGMRIKNGSLSQWANPPNWANNFEIISSGIHEEIGMPNMRWSRPYISVKTKTNGVTLSGIELFTNPSSLQDTVEFALPQLELGEIPTPFNSNDFHANNFINKFTITGVGPNGSSNGYRLFLDKDTVEYSTFNEVPIGSYFNLQLDNGLEELYKVIKISPQENNLYSVEGLQYYSGKFEQIENETYVEDQINVNVGLPLNTVTRPAPTNFIDYDVTAQLDEYGRYYIQASIVLLGLTSAERFRVSLQYPNGKYAYKETDIGENGNASVYFLNLPTAGTYTVLITSIKNPEAKIADKVTIQIPNN
jgi:hypothetical protein